MAIELELVIISGGRTARYAGVKGSGVLIWDIRLGVFDEAGTKPDPFRVLDWVSESSWDESISPIASEEGLLNPIYGRVTIDFDRQLVIDDNGYGASDEIYFDWLVRSIKSALRGDDDGLISEESLKQHFANGRIVVTQRRGVDPERSFEAKTLEDAHLECRKFTEEAHAAGEPGPAFALLRLADGWKVQEA